MHHTGQNQKQPWLGLMLPAAGFLSIIGWLLLHIDHTSPIFATCYYAAVAQAQGLNPYDLSILSSLAKSQLTVSYSFPPYILYFFRMFTGLNLPTAAAVFLLLKCALLVLMVTIWARSFITAGKATGWFYLLLILGFNSAVFLDLKFGAVAIIEQMFLWSAFYFFVNKKPGSFCLFILAAASFNLWPILFLLLLFIDTDRYSYIYLGTALAIFFGLIGVSYHHSPEHFMQFLHNAKFFSSVYDQGALSTTALFHSGAAVVERLWGIVLDGWILNSMYVACVVVVVMFSWNRITSLAYSYEKYNRVLAIFMACFVYALVNPHFTAYSYILLLPATWHVALNSLRNQRATIFLMVLVSLPLSSQLPGMNRLMVFYPLLVAVGLWILFLRDLHHARNTVRGNEVFMVGEMYK